MTACDDKRGLLVRLADDGPGGQPSATERERLDAHLLECAGCREALADQQQVAAILRSRPALPPSPGFSASLAARLDEVSGWLGILDWRTWTFRLAPLALALALVAFFTGSSSRADASAATLDTWTRGVAESSSSPASEVWQDAASADALLETMLTGASGSVRETPDVR